MKKAVCRMPVQIYERGLADIYEPGDVVEGAAAEIALAKYPEYFEPVSRQQKETKNAKE